jgi:hypothetical protein
MKAPRNSSAIAARARNSAGPMHHRNAPRGGARNEQRELMMEMEDFNAEYGSDGVQRDLGMAYPR